MRSGARPLPARPGAGHVLGVVLWPIAFAVVVLGAWQALVAITGVRAEVLPDPAEIASALYANRGLLASAAWTTLEEVLLGYLAAVVIGLALATLLHRSRHAERAIYPWLVASQMIPIPAIAPIIVIWTGFDIRPKLIVIALVSFFPIAVNTIDGLRAAEPELLDLLRTFGASRRQRFLKAELPASLPFVFSGLKIAAAFSVIGAVFAEWVGSSSGLGYLILTFNNESATTEMFAAVVILGVIGVGLFGTVALLERLALPWYYEQRAGERAVAR